MKSAFAINRVGIHRYLRERAELSRPISEGNDRMERLFVWFGRLPLLITAQVGAWGKFFLLYPRSYYGISNICSQAIYNDLDLNPSSSILDVVILLSAVSAQHVAIFVTKLAKAGLW